jgi:hypothetical protein
VLTGVTTVTGGTLNTAALNVTGAASFSGNVSIAGTLSYDDVTDIDSVGIITAQSGIHVTGGSVGIGTDAPTKLLELKGTDPTIKLWDSSGDAYALIEGDFGDQGSIRFRADPTSAGGSTHIRFDVDGSERLRIDSSGRVHIGDRTNQNATNFSTASVNISKTDDISTSFNKAACYLHIGNSESTLNGLYPIGFGFSINSKTHVPAYIAYKTINSSGSEYGDLLFATRNVNSDTEPTERLRITSGGNVLIGTTTGDTSRNSTSTRFPVFQVSSSWSSGRGSYSFTTTDDYPIIFLNSNASYADGSGAGTLVWSVKDGSGDYCNTAQITSSIDGTPGNDDSPGNLKFFTTPDGSASPSERLRITSAGKIGVNNTSTPGIFSIHDSSGSDCKLLLTSTWTSGTQQILFGGGSTTSTGTDGTTAGLIKVESSAPGGAATGSMHFFYNSGDNLKEGLRITSGGNVNIGGDYAQTDSKVTILDATKPIAEATLNLQSSTTTGAADTGPVLRFYGHSGSEGRYHASIKGAKENGTSGNTAGYLAFNTRPAGGAMAEALRLTSDGHVLKPKMAAAASGMATGTTNLSGFGGGWVQLVTDYQKFDNNGNFNPSNYRFTAPETGYYMIGCSVQLENGSGSGNRWMYLYPHINGAQTIESQGGNVSDFDPAVSYYFTWVYSSLYKLTKNDYVDWRYRGNLTSINLKGQNESVFYYYQVG